MTDLSAIQKRVEIETEVEKIKQIHPTDWPGIIADCWAIDRNELSFVRADRQQLLTRIERLEKKNQELKDRIRRTKKDLGWR